MTNSPCGHNFHYSQLYKNTWKMTADHMLSMVFVFKVEQACCHFFSFLFYFLEQIASFLNLSQDRRTREKKKSPIVIPNWGTSWWTSTIKSKLPANLNTHLWRNLNNLNLCIALGLNSSEAADVNTHVIINLNISQHCTGLFFFCKWMWCKAVI